MMIFRAMAESLQFTNTQLYLDASRAIGLPDHLLLNKIGLAMSSSSCPEVYCADMA
jgi:hypothetical protein